MTPERLEPLAPSAWTTETREALGLTLDKVASLERREEGDGGPRPLAILTTLAHHPKLLPPFLQLASTLTLEGVLSRRDSELLALRAAWNCRSEFEWGHHVRYAQHGGLSEAEISRVIEGPDADGWTPLQTTLLRAADELHASSKIGDATWGALREHFDPAALVEITFTVGQYTLLSFVANSLGVGLEEGYEPLPDAGSGRRPVG